MNESIKFIQMQELAENLNKQLVPAIKDIITGASVFDQSSAEEVVGDGAANGTSILTLSVADGKVFICTLALASSNLPAIVKIGTGTLAAMTDYFWIDCSNRGICGIMAEGNTPIFIVDNRSGGAALNVIMFAPKTAFNAATNNDANHYFNGYLGGYEI